MRTIPNNEQWRQFFDLYKRLPSLWNKNDENRIGKRNKKKISHDWDILLAKYNEIDPLADIRSLKTKLHHIRFCYSRALKRYRRRLRPLSSAVYSQHQSSLWYFNKLAFLQEHINEKNNSECGSKIKIKVVRVPLQRNYLKPNVIESTKINIEVLPLPISFEHIVDNRTEEKHLTTLKHREVLTRINPAKELKYNLIEGKNDAKKTSTLSWKEIQSKYQLTEENNLTKTFLGLNSEEIQPKKQSVENKTTESNIKNDTLAQSRPDQQSKDNVLIFAANWAIQFKNLKPEQQIYAKKAIQDIFFLGQLEQLTSNTVQTDLVDMPEIIQHNNNDDSSLTMDSFVDDLIVMDRQDSYDD